LRVANVFERVGLEQHQVSSLPRLNGAHVSTSEREPESSHREIPFPIDSFALEQLPASVNPPVVHNVLAFKHVVVGMLSCCQT
jgi:hypothetical protein